VRRLAWTITAGLALALAFAGCARHGGDTGIKSRAGEADSLMGAPRVAKIEPAVEIESTLVRFNDALAHGDRDSILALTTPEFALLEDGQVYDREGTVISVTRALELGSMLRTPVDFVTGTRGNVGWSRYHVVGEFHTERQRLLLSRIESAVLVRDEHGWRLAQMSSQAESSP
jgi:hypothetical protein